jgi:RimJ/RimL family protein N-acetyltransferase
MYEGMVRRVICAVKPSYRGIVSSRVPVPRYPVHPMRRHVMPTLFQADRLTVRTAAPTDVPAILEVYRQCEDFLSLGPVPVASRAMVTADIKHAETANGSFCVIEDEAGRVMGVLEFSVAEPKRTAVLYLLMISRRHRKKGCGTAVVRALESYLRGKYSVETIESGVQVNNPDAIRFWKRCGFQVDTVPRNHEDGTTAFEMTRTLRCGE